MRRGTSYAEKLGAQMSELHPRILESRAAHVKPAHKQGYFCPQRALGVVWRSAVTSFTRSDADRRATVREGCFLQAEAGSAKREAAEGCHTMCFSSWTEAGKRRKRIGEGLTGQSPADSPPPLRLPLVAFGSYTLARSFLNGGEANCPQPATAAPDSAPRKVATANVWRFAG